ncbi:MAG: hypothetical protein QOI94_2942 [Acidobacteriaceae bacterium]|nr:hypothetical protein [Acidobacteriaceae bacterium]
MQETSGVEAFANIYSSFAQLLRYPPNLKLGGTRNPEAGG